MATPFGNNNNNNNIEYMYVQKYGNSIHIINMKTLLFTINNDD